MLGDQHVGRELAHQRRHHGVEGAQPAGVGGARRQRDVDRAALGARAAGVGREAGAGEQHLAGLVQGDREHPRVVVEDPPRRRRRGGRRRRRRRPARRPGRAATGCRPRRRCRRRSRWPGRASRGAGRRRCWRRAATSPVQTWRAASTVAPTTCAAASCMSAEDRVVVGAEPELARRRAPGRRRPGCTASISAGVVHGGDQVVVGDRRRRPSRSAVGRAPRARAASRMVRSTRTGTSGGRARSRTR